MVEFALVLPLFLLILAGILDFGFLLYSRMTVINAAREGARTSITTSDPTTIPSIARGAAQGAAAGIGGAGVTVASTCVALKTAGSCNWSTKTSSQPGDAVAVTVNYTYHTFFPLLFGATIPISATVQMVLE